MPSPKAAPLLVSLAVAAILALLWLFLGGDPTPADGAADSEASASTSAATLSVESSTAAELTAGSAEPTVRAAVAGAGAGSATIRGRVLDGWSLQPLAGVEVLAVTTLPNFERLETHLRSTMMGLWKPDPAPPRVLGSTMSGADGSFELRGLPSGRVFLDGRSERYFVRTPALVRLAGDETREGIELLCFPGGRVRGRVFGPEGTPVAGATVSVRPGPNAFLGQITSRNYRWLEGTTDASGYFDLHGVPEGHGYTVSAVGPAMALVEVHGVSVEIGQATNVDLHAVAGGTLLGKVVDAHGNPVEGAEVATVYLDLSRALFSGAGRAPVRTDADGQFVLHHVAPGPLALMAAKDGLGPSQIEQLEVVDGGVYDDFLLELGGGATVTGIVVDDREQPLADALVEIVPMERPQDPDVVKTVLRLREVTARTGRDGRFTVAGVAGDRILVQASKPGYVTRVQFGVRPSAQLRLALERGATVRGRVVGDDGKPIARFRVETTSREGGSDAEPEERRARRSMQGIAMGRQPREASLRLRAGSKISERRPGDEWQELHDAEGRFELSGLPPGKIRVRVRADGWLDPQAREVTLAAGETSDELVFQLAPGLSVRGVVVDAVTNRPVPEAQVTAYRESDGRRDRGVGPLRFRGDVEDFDFLGLSSLRGRRSVLTDAHGRFTLGGLAAGEYRLTARHPDRAKASATDVEVVEGKETPSVEIRLTAGGAIEGFIRGRSGLPVANALIVAATLGSGALKSTTSGPDGAYRIDGLPAGRYFVFKSRLEENATNLVYDLLGNMRLRSVSVEEGKVTRKDIEDEGEGTVRVFGVVRDGSEPVARAMVTALGQDSDGVLGIGIRARPTDVRGEYELIGLQPGSYFFQVVRFNRRPDQVNLEVEIPEGVTEFRVDLDLPQSSISGRVVDGAGQPVAGVEVNAGVEDGGLVESSGLLGLLLRNGVNRARTDGEGRFKLDRLPQGTYRLTARGRGRDQRAFGEAEAGPFPIDGRTPVGDVTIVLPRAGVVRGVVRDGNGAPVAGAEIGYVLARDGRRARGERDLADLFGVQRRPVRTAADGTFRIEGLTPGRYTFHADLDDRTSEPVRDIEVVEEGEVQVALTLIRGATLKFRVRNVDGSMVRPGSVQILDGAGRPVTRSMSAASLFRRFMGNREKLDDSGWREVGNVPPDTYTLVVTEPGKPERRFTRTIRDGEVVTWDVDLAATLEEYK